MSKLKVLNSSKFNFNDYIKKSDLNLSPISIETLQINITKLCNQACLHCHVESSPKRKEQMDLETVNACLKILKENHKIKKLDLTGGAPELNPHFDYLVLEARKLNKNVMVRHNLTVVIDGNPVTKESKEYIPEFYAKNKVEVICSLPYYQEFFTDKQRGDGVFKKSIEVLKRFNSLGYGSNKDLKLNLVYNPIGAYLPAAQEVLEKQYKKELLEKFNIRFNELFVITNMPIHRFKKQLAKLNTYDDYMTKLVNAYNPDAAKGIMCRSLISVSYDGNLYDCDFNQMLEMNVDLRSMNVFNFDYKKLLTRKIMFDSHCFGCTAGAGSSCGGEITN